MKKKIATKNVLLITFYKISEEHNKTTYRKDNSKNNFNNNISFMNNKSVTLEKQPLLVIPYQSKKGDHILKWFRKDMIKMFSHNVKSKIAFTGRKLGTSFQIKDKTEMKHNCDIVYYNECPEEQCIENYNGESISKVN